MPLDLSDNVRNEQTKATAVYFNTIAGAFFAAGVIAPVAAFVFGVLGSGDRAPTLTLGIGVLIFLLASVAAHFAARRVLRRLRP